MSATAAASSSARPFRAARWHWPAPRRIPRAVQDRRSGVSARGRARARAGRSSIGEFQLATTLPGVLSWHRSQRNPRNEAVRSARSRRFFRSSPVSTGILVSTDGGHGGRGILRHFQVLDQQLQAPFTLPVVDVQAIGQPQASGRRLTVPLAIDQVEGDGIKACARADRAQPAFDMLLADDARRFDVEIAVKRGREGLPHGRNRAANARCQQLSLSAARNQSTPQIGLDQLETLGHRLAKARAKRSRLARCSASPAAIAWPPNRAIDGIARPTDSSTSRTCTPGWTAVRAFTPSRSRRGDTGAGSLLCGLRPDHHALSRQDQQVGTLARTICQRQDLTPRCMLLHVPRCGGARVEASAARPSAARGASVPQQR